MTTPLPALHQIRRSRPELVLQMLIAGVLLALAVVLLLGGGVTRAQEARLMAPVFDAMTPGTTVAIGESLFADVNAGPVVTGLRITFMCSAALLLAPLLVQAALMVASGRFSVLRVLSALCVSLPLVCTVNAVRIGTIGWARAHWGDAGYDVSHHLIAALMALFGFVLALLVQTRLSMAPERRRRVRTPASRDGW